MTSVDELQVHQWPLLTTTSLSMTSVDELQPRRWLLLTNNKSVSGFCCNLHVRRWLLLTNYKTVSDFCWRTTSPSVTSVDELPVCPRSVISVELLIAILTGTWVSYKPSPTGEDFLAWAHCRTWASYKPSSTGVDSWHDQLSNMRELQALLTRVDILIRPRCHTSELQAQLMEVDYCCPW